MRSRIVALVIAVVLVQIAAAFAAPAALAQEGIRPDKLDRDLQAPLDDRMDLYQFDFDAHWAIESRDGAFPETVLVTIVAGSFVLFQDDVDDRDDRFIIDARATGGVIQTLAPAADYNVEEGINFDPPMFAETIDCGDHCVVEDRPNEPMTVNGTRFEDERGLVLEPGTVVALPGPFHCVLCALGLNGTEARAEASTLQVAVVKQNGDFSWTNPGNWTIEDRQFEATASPTAGGAGARLLPALNPGGCKGKGG